MDGSAEKPKPWSICRGISGTSGAGSVAWLPALQRSTQFISEAAVLLTVVTMSHSSIHSFLQMFMMTCRSFYVKRRCWLFIVTVKSPLTSLLMLPCTLSIFWRQRYFFLFCGHCHYLLTSWCWIDNIFYLKDLINKHIRMYFFTDIINLSNRWFISLLINKFWQLVYTTTVSWVKVLCWLDPSTTSLCLTLYAMSPDFLFPVTYSMCLKLHDKNNKYILIKHKRT